jgi:hypothetical protein
MATNRTGHDDLHAVAERFVREYLAKTGSQHEPVKLSPAPRPRCIESHAVAQAFVKEHLRKRREIANASKQTEAERFEIEEPPQVILVRRSGSVTSYFYGWKAQRPLFTHAQHLAQVIDVARSDELVQMLRLCNIEVTTLPAPEVHRGSL